MAAARIGQVDRCLVSRRRYVALIQTRLLCPKYLLTYNEHTFIMASSFEGAIAMEPKKSLIHEDLRVPLAAERTFLAWIRTGLALMGVAAVFYLLFSAR
jgi:hypothetical protein